MPPRSRRSAELFLLLTIAAGCQRGNGQPASTAPPAQDGAVTVAVATPKRQTLTWSVEQPGSVQPFEVTPIEARVAGYIKKVNADIGDEVKTGTVLAEIDVPDLVQEVARKKATIEFARAEAEQARQAVRVAEAAGKVAAAAVREAEAGVVKAQADVDRWESELARVEKLSSGGGSVDLQTRDETKR